MNTSPSSSGLRRSLLALMLALCGTLCGGCQVHYHQVGGGATGVGDDSARQYYLFFGLMRLNEVSAQRLANELTSYDIESEFAFHDLLLAPLLLPLTVTSRTVTVYR